MESSFRMVSHSITRRSNDVPASINSTKVKQTSGERRASRGGPPASMPACATLTSFAYSSADGAGANNCGIFGSFQICQRRIGTGLARGCSRANGRSRRRRPGSYRLGLDEGAPRRLRRRRPDRRRRMRLAGEREASRSGGRSPERGARGGWADTDAQLRGGRWRLGRPSSPSCPAWAGRRSSRSSHASFVRQGARHEPCRCRGRCRRTPG